MISIFFLAFIQGISEFLPISSSAHLIIFRDLFMIGKDVISSDIALTFDVSLHFGTLLAIIIYFYKDFLNMTINIFNKDSKERNITFCIILSTIPAALVGLFFEDIIENVIRTKYIIISLSLIIMGIILYYSDMKMKKDRSLNNMNFKDAILIGFSQIFALIPGFSRSGVTITSARLLKINREDATKYSFYMSFPILIGAVILKSNFKIIIENINIFIVGITVSFITGIFCIKVLLNYVKTNNFKVFMWYRLLMGLIIFLYLILHY